MNFKQWQSFKLEEIIESGTTITYGVVKPGDEDDNGVKFIRGGDISNGKISTNNLRTITKQVSEQYKRTQLQGGELVISLVGNPGEVAIVPPELKGANLARQVGVVRLKKDIEKEFVKYFLISPLGKERLFAKSVGSVQQVINLSDLRELEIHLPDLSTQRCIAGILSALDEKIELNRQTNATLEAIAQSVFKEWFVEGEQVNTWDELTWGEVATLEYGKSLIGYKDSNASFVVYGTNGAIGKHTQPLYPSEGIIVGRKGAYRGIHYSPDPFFVIDTAFYLKPKKSFSMKWAYYELLRFDLNSMDSGSAIPSTSRTDFYDIPVVFPPQELMNSFETFVTPLFTKIYANEKEIHTLSNLRDSLLPKLMIGEIEVNDD